MNQTTRFVIQIVYTTVVLTAGVALADPIPASRNAGATKIAAAQNPSFVQVPEPMTLLLVGTVLIGFGLGRRKRPPTN